MARNVLAEGILIWKLVAAHENHMFQEMCEARSMVGIIEGASVYRDRAISKLRILLFLFLLRIIVCNKQYLNVVLKLKL